MQGKIISNISNLYYIEANEKIYTCNARGKLKDEGIVVGDIVDFDENENIIEKIEERDNYIKRPKISNITQIVCVLSAKNPKPDLLMLDKQLAYSEKIKIEPIIIVNKCDLKDEYKTIKELYTKVGYKVIVTSAKQNIGIDELKQELQNKTSVFSGNSGVGKSSIINALFDKEKTQEGEISKKNKKGKNTTTDTKLYKLEKDTYIADTPGFSSFEISEIESTGLDKCFREFVPEIENCEFIGCTHIKEENCGIKKAIESEKISVERYERYCKIYSELKEKEKYKW